MNCLLTNVNKLPIIAKHLSSQFKLNQVADLQCWYTPPCNVNNCSIHKFIDKITSTVIDQQHAAHPSKWTHPSPALKAAQQNSDSCKVAASHLTSGKVPQSPPGNQHNEMRHNVRHTSLAPDRLLITAGDSHLFTPGGEKNKIIVPHNVAPGLLYHLHNRTLGQHPPMSQLKALFNRSFYTWNLQPLLDLLY